MYINICVCMYVHIMYICVCMYVHIMYVCMYVYTYIRMPCTYVHTYVLSLLLVYIISFLNQILIFLSLFSVIIKNINTNKGGICGFCNNTCGSTVCAISIAQSVDLQFARNIYTYMYVHIYVCYVYVCMYILLCNEYY